MPRARFDFDFDLDSREQQRKGAGLFQNARFRWEKRRGYVGERAYKRGNEKFNGEA